MNAKEKAPTGAATSARAGQEKRQGKAAIPCDYSTTNGADRQPLRVADVLCRGKANAQTMRELRQFLNGDSRSIRLKIEHERRSGYPILSDCRHGYWLAETRAEIETFVRSMRSRAFEIQKTAALVQLATLNMEADSND